MTKSCCYMTVAIIALALPMAADAGQLNSVEDRSFVDSNGESVLELSVVVPAPVDEVWRAMTTTEGYIKWAAPVANIDFRVGGVIESSYDPSAALGTNRTIRNEIVSIVSRRLLVIRNIQAPPDTPFDAAIFQRLQTALEFEPIDADSTRVTLLNGGYRDEASYDAVYRFFRKGNQTVLEQLRDRFARRSENEKKKSPGN